MELPMDILENQHAKIVLKPGRNKSVENRHPWVFSGAVQTVSGEPQPGDIVPVYSHQERFLAKGFWNPHSQICMRLLTFRDEPITVKFFHDRLQHAIRFRQSYVENTTNSCRYVNGNGDGLPGVIIDRYDRVLVVQFYSLGMARLKQLLIEWLQAELKPVAILERSEGRGLSEEGLSPNTAVLAGNLPDEVIIEEHGHRFYADVLTGQKSGFFLDQRENRRMMAEYTRNKQVLNCFAYTGGFSVYAARQGAVTTSVEVSAPALELARRNFKLNGLNPEEHNFIAANVFHYLRNTGQQYEVIVLDPPAFVKQKKDLNKGARGYKDINRLALQHLKEGGLLLTCSCSKFVNWDLFQKIVFSAAQEAGRAVQIVARPGQPIDHPFSVFHPEGEYLKTFLLRAIE